MTDWQLLSIHPWQRSVKAGNVGSSPCPRCMVRISHAIGQVHCFLVILDTDINGLFPTILVPSVRNLALGIHKHECYITCTLWYTIKTSSSPRSRAPPFLASPLSRSWEFFVSFGYPRHFPTFRPTHRSGMWPPRQSRRRIITLGD